MYTPVNPSFTIYIYKYQKTGLMHDVRIFYKIYLFIDNIKYDFGTDLPLQGQKVLCRLYAPETPLNVVCHQGKHCHSSSYFRHIFRLCKIKLLKLKNKYGKELTCPNI